MFHRLSCDFMIDIRNDPRIEQWFGMADLKDATRQSYSVYMQEFCDCIEKTPSELITEAINETRKGLLLSERQTVIYITKFRKCLSDKKLSPKTQALASSIVRSFYNTFDIQLSSSISKQKKTLPLKENQYFLTKDDIKKLITNVKNLREKAIILCMTTSGMARNEILNLKIKDIKFDDDSGIGIINVRREKAQIDYTTFISPEAVIALKNYWAERNRDINTAIKDSGGYVFVTYKNNKNGVTGDKIGDRVFLQNFRELGEQLGFSNGEGFLIKSRSHAFRKYFASTLENAGMPKNKIDFMLGHTPSGNDLAYFKTNINTLKELYITFLPYLTFEKTIEVRSLNREDAKRLEEIKIENDKLKGKIIELEKGTSEVDNLKAKVAKMESMLSTLTTAFNDDNKFGNLKSVNITHKNINIKAGAPEKPKPIENKFDVEGHIEKALQIRKNKNQ